ncbi:hypothetical protein GCM10022221_23080 [Actinocorallia aurea]
MWGALSSAGVTAIFTASHAAYTALRWAGAVYLVWVGVRMRRTRRPRRSRRAWGDSWVAGWRQGVWVLPGEETVRPPASAPAPPSTDAPAPAATGTPPPVPDAAAWWEFTAADDPAPERFGNAKLDGDGLLILDGLSGHAVADVPGLDPAAGFTVAVRARFDGYGTTDRRDVTLASLPGKTSSAFLLQYKSTWGVDGWHFVMPRADASEPQSDSVSSSVAPEKGRWYAVVGVHDPAAKRISLYVDGERQASARHTATWKTPGPLDLGAHLWAGLEGGHWPGALDKAAVYPRALTPAEIRTLSSW